ncbi:MAG: hypothetical protein RBT25_02380 [Lentisphaeria bacterium]|nr:hypothetical protein [Lentisphaeria bacterium]
MKLPIKFAVITALVLFSLTTRLGAKPANGKISLLPGADSSLEAAVESLQPDGGLLELGAGIYRLEETSIPENVDLHFLPGAVLEVAKNLKINGGLKAGERQIFSGSGTVSGMVKTAVVLPQWFGAKADGMHDDTRAIQQAADLAQFSSGKLLRLSPGSYVFSDSINIRCNVDCRGTLLQRLEVDHEKTKHSNFTYVPSHFVRKVFRISIVYMENCHIFNASTIFSSREDIGDFYGTVTLKNIVVDSDLDVSLLTVSVSPDFDYAHDLRLPSQVTIQNVRNQGKGSLGIYGRFDQSSPHGGFQTLLLDVGSLKSVTWPVAVQFESCIFEQAKFNVKDATFRFCEFRGENSGLEQASPQSLLNINAPFAAP